MLGEAIRYVKSLPRDAARRTDAFETLAKQIERHSNGAWSAAARLTGGTPMNTPGTLLNCDEAVRFIEQIQDPVTKNLVNMAFVHLVKTVHLENRNLPKSNLDMLFLVTSLQPFFAEHDVIARTLEGEKVGAWFDEGM
jgi:hypothetical protein